MNCKKLKYEQRLKLFNDLYGLEDYVKENNYVMSLIHVCKIKRRRPSKTESVRSTREVTIRYTIPDGEGDVLEVCRKTFLDIFGFTARRVATLIKFKKAGSMEYVEKRGNKLKHRKYNEVDEQSVVDHVNSFPREVSHYSREKTDKEFLSQDLNVHRMYAAYSEKFPESKVTYRFYSKVFKKYFPNLRFRQLRSDTCKTCDLLNAELKCDPRNREKKFQLEHHHRKAEQAMATMKNDNVSSQFPSSEMCCAAMDLQKVLSLPTLTHSEMYYLRQLSNYNFCIDLADNQTGLMFLWHEGISGRGGNEIASCVFKAFTSNITKKNKLILWSDNCTGQNKNRMFIFLWLYLTSKDIFTEINQKFLVKGHTYMSCDRNFGHIEKRKRLEKCQVPHDLVSMILTASHKRHSMVTVMQPEDFYNFKLAADHFIDTKKLQISKAQWIRVSTNKPGIIQIKETFSDIETWKEVMVFKKNIKADALVRYQIPLLPQNNKLSTEKKRDLKRMIPFLKEENKHFFEDLVNE